MDFLIRPFGNPADQPADENCRDQATGTHKVEYVHLLAKGCALKSKPRIFAHCVAKKAPCGVIGEERQNDGCRHHQHTVGLAIVGRRCGSCRSGLAQRSKRWQSGAQRGEHRHHDEQLHKYDQRKHDHSGERKVSARAYRSIEQQVACNIAQRTDKQQLGPEPCQKTGCQSEQTADILEHRHGRSLAS